NSYGASGRGSSDASISSVCPPRSESRAIFAPMCESSRPMVRMSASSGTLRKTLRPGASSAAAICGSVAFFEPLTSTSPFSGTPPSISIASIRKAPYVRSISRFRGVAENMSIESGEVLDHAHAREPGVAEPLANRRAQCGIDLQGEQPAGNDPPSRVGDDPFDDCPAGVGREERLMRFVGNDLRREALLVVLGDVRG